jgi:branched-chain amino acid transport system substrate-binding protein
MKPMRSIKGHRLTTVWTCAILIAVTLGCSEKHEKVPIRIGADLALSGPVAFWGESIQQGLQLAAEQYAQAHPDSPVTIVYEDNQGEAKNSITIMRKLCTADNVSCVVSVLTPLSKPLRPLASELKTPLLGTVVASLNFGKENEWSFRDYPTPDQLSGLIAEYGYRKLGLRRAVALVVDDEYGNDSRTLFKEKFAALGGQVAGTDTVTQKDTDVRAQVTKLLALNPDSAFLVIRENVLGIAVRQFRELGFKGQILGINAFDSPVVWQACGSYGEGVIFSSAHIDYEGNPEAAAFSAAFRKRFQKEPNHTHAYGYSIGSYLLPLAARAEGDPMKMRELLASLEADSLRGHIKMLPTRDILTPVALYQRHGDRNLLLEEK